MSQWIKANPFEGLVDCITAYSSLTVLYDVSVAKNAAGQARVHAFVREYLEKAYRFGQVPATDAAVRLVSIPVCYDGDLAPDMEDVCRMTGLTRSEVIALHCGRTYPVYMVGFLPGFAYLAEVDQRLAVSRKPRPRARVEAGSVGVAGVQTGVYPVASPGGWQIIGRTPLTMFDAKADPPVWLRAGDEVKFYAIDYAAYEQLIRK
jgi:inhibitor of KinA